ncbi:MAG TPA: hypothetical protein VG500_10435 [Gemmatimonadales bacterium]|jgi:hypothetical protein|nr:hypothetical protein [Gemmatimonadales bacterium]
MNATTALYALGTCLMAATMAVSPTGPSWFEARTTGVKSLTLRGSAEFGSVADGEGTGPFVLTLGADSPTGAVVFTDRTGGRPEVGIYQLGEDPARAIQALVITGSPEWPTGAYRARSGRLTVTRSSDDFVAGQFDLDAVGFEASNPLDEERTLRVRGTFTATPGR